MISEPKTGAVKKEAFRFPVAVSLPPKRRFRRCSSSSIFGDKETGESIVPIISPVRRGYRLRRSGRLVFRSVHPKLLASVAQAASYTP
jgi:hypothetical protein